MKSIKIRRRKAQNGRLPEKTERKKGPDSRHVWTGRKTAPEFAVSVSHMDQLREALALVQEKREDGAETPFGIYLAGEEFDPGQWKELADRCHKAGSACYLMMPRIFRSQAEQVFPGPYGGA